MQDSNVLKVKELREENKKLKSLITDLLKLSDNEFSILQDGIDAALSLLKIDPIIRMRQGIDREAIKSEFKSHLAEKSAARKKVIDIDKLVDCDEDIDSADSKKKTTTGKKESVKKENKSIKSKDDTSSKVVDSCTSEVIDEVEEIAGPLVGSRKKIEDTNLPEPKFVENNGKDSKKLNRATEIINSFRAGGPRTQANEFLNKKSYASLFVNPKTASLRDATKYYMILTKISRDCDRTVVAPATNLMFNVLNNLDNLDYVADEKFKYLLQLKFEGFECEGFKQAVDYVINNIADYRDIFENYTCYMQSFKISFNEAKTDLPLKKAMYGLSNSKYCSESDIKHVMNV